MAGSAHADGRFGSRTYNTLASTSGFTRTTFTTRTSAARTARTAPASTAPAVPSIRWRARSAPAAAGSSV